LRTLTILLCITLAPWTVAAGEPEAQLTSLSGSAVSGEALERTILQIMEKGGVPGLSCAIINDSKIVFVRGFGVVDRETNNPVDGETIFAAASFSKTVFAYLVLLLVEDGAIDLDKPLHAYLEKPLPEYPLYSDLEGDPRYKKITARIALSHTTGFPNWRVFTDDGKLRIFSEPGERFGYSGEGISLLQLVVEEVTGTGLEALARERVFAPLGMTRTSYVWHDEFEENLALPHDAYERPRPFRKRRTADAAGSMATTAGDYARLLVALLNAEGKHRVAVDKILEPQITIRSSAAFGPGARDDRGDYGNIDLYWGLGWGLFECEHGKAMFHTGHEGGTQNYNVTFTDKGIGVVFLSNGDNFESVARQLAEATIGDTYSPFTWLGYPRYDPNRRREPPPEPVIIEVDAAILASYAGTYELGAGTSVFVKYSDGVLLGSSDGLDWAELHAETETRFFVRGEDTRLVFVRNEAGDVTELILIVEGGAELHAPKVE